MGHSTNYKLALVHMSVAENYDGKIIYKVPILQPA